MTEVSADELAAEFHRASVQVKLVTEKAVDLAGAKLSKVMADDSRRSTWFPLHRDMGYDFKAISDGAEVEVGARKGGIGSLAHIAYFGGANGGGGTIRDPERAMEDVEPEFLDVIGEVHEVLWGD